MPWWIWVPAVLFLIILLPAGLGLLLPLRIFGRYHRENRRDQISLRIKLGFFHLRLELWQEEGAGGGLEGYLAAGRFRIPAVRLQGMAGRMGWTGDLRDLRKAAGILRLRRQLGPQLKGITWSRFDLELSWGWDDPALTGLAAGGCWALGGVLTGFLQEYFSVTGRPRLQVQPRFSPAELQLRWEGEASLSLYRALRLWLLIRKIGGARSG